MMLWGQLVSDFSTTTKKLISCMDLSVIFVILVSHIFAKLTTLSGIFCLLLMVNMGILIG